MERLNTDIYVLYNMWLETAFNFWVTGKKGGLESVETINIKAPSSPPLSGWGMGSFLF